ncbi:uncharacterized protein [Zea mays]|uniref:uncharacterized protein isoform X2 n=1 Tax=Zea mays TaxID=4577 RepID=UPI000C6C7809|nr:uncharacterized protein LOC103641807 isoform X2 [Zea mays]|eukprot:XP_008663360.2 uncharacterized protein LOC103641807 isoform X2 [Zea mays]
MKGQIAPVVSQGDGDGSCSHALSSVKSPLYDAAATHRQAKVIWCGWVFWRDFFPHHTGRKASAAPSFVLDAAGMQELLDAAAARKQTGDAAPSVAKRTGMGKAAAAGSTRLQRAMEADFQGAGTAEGRQRPGTALGLKRKVAAMAAAPSVVAPPVHDFTTFCSTASSIAGSQAFSSIPNFTSGHAISSPTTPPWVRSEATDPAACS